MYITVDDNHYVTCVLHGGILVDGIEVDDFDFAEEINFYQYIEDAFVLDEEKKQRLGQEQKVQVQIEDLQMFLQDTDYVSLRHLEEKELGIATSQNESVYTATFQKRQEAREQIRKLRSH